MENRTLRRLTFDDETQTIRSWYRGSHEGKAIAVKKKEVIEDRIEYFKRKLIGE